MHFWLLAYLSRLRRLLFGCRAGLGRTPWRLQAGSRLPFVVGRTLVFRPLEVSELHRQCSIQSLPRLLEEGLHAEWNTSGPFGESALEDLEANLRLLARLSFGANRFPG